MLVLALMLGCSKDPLSPDDVRAELDNPTARLSASSIPDVADDFFASKDAWGGEASAWGWVDLGRSNARIGAEGMRDRVMDRGNLERMVNPALGGIFCAADFVLQLSSFEECSRGDTCEVELVLKACMLNLAGDEAAKGKLRFTLREEQQADFDRGSLSLGFEDWRYTNGDFWAELDGLLAIEGTSWHDGSKEEILYTSDFSLRSVDPDARGLFRSGEVFERRARAALRFTYEDLGGSETGTVEILAWVDEDGDGREDGSVVVRFGVEVSPLADGTLAGFTVELIDATGTWSCAWTTAEQSSGDGGTTWTSGGTCTDPSGATVSFDGSVTD